MGSFNFGEQPHPCDWNGIEQPQHTCQLMDSLNKISSSGWQQFKAIGSGNKTTTQKSEKV